ncbi:MAG TPA: hypothetical protein VHI13_22275 [Candidatus Kapabacteria bacterium]|nr:hypothetical protein [Candidatus Kapabacteria bacterium]
MRTVRWYAAQRPLISVSLSLLLLIVAANAVPATAGNTDNDAEIVRMEFSGSGRILLRPDPTPEVPFSEIEPRWSRGGRNLSVAYVSGSVPVLSVTIELPAAAARQPMMLRGIGPDDLSFPAVAVKPAFNGTVATLLYPARQALRSFEPSMVCTYEPFTVQWETSTDGGATWACRALSRNTIYVTLARPVEEQPEVGYACIESLLAISCRDANGATTEAEVISDVWQDFRDCVVRTVSGDTLAFYRHKRVDPQATTAGLLFTKSGVCYAWAHLLIDLLRVHGITRHNCYVLLTAPAATAYGPVDGMLMKNCQFGNASGAEVCPDFPYVAAFDPHFTFDLIGPDVYSRPGLPAQGEPDPVALFRDHSVVFLDGMYYDPSYGRTYSSLDEFYNYIAGWVVRGQANELAVNYDLNGDGKIEDRVMTIARVSSDPHHLALSVTRSDY